MIKRLLPIFISVFVISVNVLCAEASGNILREVGVSINSDSNTPYTVELTSTIPARMTKTIVSANRIIINLKDIRVSSNVTTKFNGNKVTDNIMVEPCGQDNVNVMVQGDNIAYSNIEFKSPTAFETTSDNIKSSFSSLFSILSGSSLQDRSVQLGLLIIFLSILIAEIGFIKSKYNELELEKAKMIKDIEATDDFQNYLPNYDKSSILKKPYTTPIYNSTVVNTSVSRPHSMTPLKTKESMTLNSLLYNRNREDKIINRIVNNKPVFGELSNIHFENLNPLTNVKSKISSPIEKSRLKANIKYLESMTEKYKSKTTTIRDLNDIGQDMASRLNRIY